MENREKASYATIRCRMLYSVYMGGLPHCKSESGEVGQHCGDVGGEWCRRYYDLHFTDKESESQTGSVSRVVI